MSNELREEARKREEERAALARERELFVRDLQTLSALPEVRRVFRWLIGQGNIFAEDYQPGPIGAYRAGVRAASLRLWRVLREHLPTEAFVAVALDSGREDTAPTEERRWEGDARGNDYF